MRIPSMSAFQRSTIALSCLSACVIERIHIFEERSSPLVARTARRKYDFREETLQVVCEYAPSATFPLSSSLRVPDFSESIVTEELRQKGERRRRAFIQQRLSRHICHGSVKDPNPTDRLGGAKLSSELCSVGALDVLKFP